VPPAKYFVSEPVQRPYRQRRARADEREPWLRLARAHRDTERARNVDHGQERVVQSRESRIPAGAQNEHGRSDDRQREGVVEASGLPVRRRGAHDEGSGAAGNRDGRSADWPRTRHSPRRCARQPDPESSLIARKAHRGGHRASRARDRCRADLHATADRGARRKDRIEAARARDGRTTSALHKVRWPRIVADVRARREALRRLRRGARDRKQRSR
jgi:hypothetical protein